MRPAHSLCRTLVSIALTAGMLGTINAQYGVLDPTFGTAGAVVLSDHDGSATSILTLPDDRILVGGSEGQAISLYQMLPDGAPDPTFGTDGSVITWVPIPFGFSVFKIVRAGNGDIIVVGRTKVSGTDYQVSLTRYDSNGVWLTSFGTEGLVHYNEGPGNLYPADAGLTSDGRLTVCAGTGSSTYLLRFLDDGSLDTTFSTDGVVEFPENGEPSSMAIDADDRIIVAGQFGGNSVQLARFDVAGVLDPSFGMDGMVSTDLVSGGAYEFAFALAVEPDGSVLVAGTVTNQQYLFAERYDVNGVLDPGFGTNGRATTPVADVDGQDLLRQADGSLVLTGFLYLGSTEDIVLVRLLPDGFPDPSFGSDGVTIATVNTFDAPDALAQQSGGAILVAGWTSADSAKWLIARFTSDLHHGMQDERVSEEAVRLYPVPAADHFTVELWPHIAGACEVQLQDATGRIVHKENVAPHSANARLQVANIAEGMYTVAVISGNGAMFNGRLIVAR